ncbi:MAG: zinc-dependent metalloprotease [Nitriliruptoraceae bacterium]
MHDHLDSGSLVDEHVALWAAAVVIPRLRATPADVEDMRTRVAADVDELEDAARAWTGLAASAPRADVQVVGRRRWVELNLAAMRGMFEPLRPRLEGRPGAPQILGAQLGAMFGLLSSKVLGQYVIPLGGGGGGQLTIVGPNLLRLTQEHGALADDLRRAVLVHEITHHLQFEAAPWLAGHLRGLVAEYLADARLGRDAFGDVVERIPELVTRIRRDRTVSPLLEVVLTDDQRAVIDRAQGLMSMIEGHANTAMFDASAGLIAEPDRLRELLERRRTDVVSRILRAIGGLDLKRRQYRDGERFVREVIDLAGVRGLNRVFDGPDRLPDVDEVAEPSSWVARVRAA